MSDPQQKKSEAKKRSKIQVPNVKRMDVSLSQAQVDLSTSRNAPMDFPLPSFNWLAKRCIPKNV